MNTPESTTDQLSRQIHYFKPPTALPPVDQWHPERVGEIDIRIARDGTWYHEGEPIRRKELVRLFSTILRCDEDGHSYLVTPAERLRIEVEDAHFLVTDMDVSGEGDQRRFCFTTQVGDQAVAGPDHPLWIEENASGEPAPYLLIRGRLRGRLTRALFYHLVEQAEERMVDDKQQLGIVSDGIFFALGAIAE